MIVGNVRKREKKQLNDLAKAKMSTIKDEYKRRNMMQKNPFDLEKVQLQREIAKL